MKTISWRLLLVCCSAVLSAHNGWALDDGDGTSVNCNDFNEFGNAYFGDTHVHTRYSIDAYTQGIDTTPDQAYLFAKGETGIVGPYPLGNGEPKIITIEPLDFAMVSDHAEFFGEQSICLDPANPLYGEPECVVLRERNNNSLIQWNILLGAQQDSVARFGFCGANGNLCSNASTGAWQVMQQAAEDHYDTSEDCSFTTFVGYEWTGAPTGFNQSGQLETLNLHRNVMFRNSIVPDKPTTYLDQPYPEILWNKLEQQCLNYVDGTNRCDVITIPHNSNLSQGKIFETTFNGNPYNLNLATRRQKFEPVVEVMQHKGQSECLFKAGNALLNDELCTFEAIPWGHLSGNISFVGPTVPKEEGTVRYALKEGLALHNKLGANPFRYGMIGSTDTHLGTPGLTEETVDYVGHGGAGAIPTGTGGTTVLTDTPEYNPGGLAVVWAQQNSRAALFDAMKRREVYATSGPRHTVRFYGGFGLPSDICGQTNLPQSATAASAVPMGGLLNVISGGQNPKFVVHGFKDAAGNNLQTIQIIKGWTDTLGTKHESVTDIVGGPDNGSSVDLNTCAVTSGTPSYTEVCQLWEDTAFNPDERAFYYARVIEEPSCRWTHRQCLAANPPINCFAAEYLPTIPKTVRERSWTSPIWYNKPPQGC